MVKVLRSLMSALCGAFARDDAPPAGEPPGAYRAIFDAHPLPMWIYEPVSLRILEVNQAAVREYGWSREEFLRLTLHDLRDPAAAAGEPGPESVEADQFPADAGLWRQRRKSGEAVAAEVTVCPVVFGGQPARAALVRVRPGATDAASALRQTEARYRALVDLSPEAVIVNAPDLSVLAANRPAALVFGSGTPEALVGLPPDALVAPEDRPRLAPTLERVLEDGSVRDVEFTLLKRDGTAFPALVSASVVRDDTGRPAAFLAVVRDLTEQRLIEEKLRHYAYHDTLTSLPNSALFREHVNRSVRRAARQDDYRYAVLIVDLDRFRHANDWLGRAGADMLLLGVASRLKDCLRPGDVLSRFGGDEFAILLNGLREDREALDVAARIHDVLRQPFVIGNQELYVSASVGLANGTPAHAHAEDLLREAAAALERAKAGGKGRSVRFTPGMGSPAGRLARLETDLRRAVREQEFRIHYQPIVSLKTGAVVAVEALVRWKHAERDLVLPSEFIPLAEETGLIESIGEWVLRQACADRAEWRIAGAAAPRVAVNVSARQFQQQELPRLVRDALDRAGLPPSALALEITESAAMENLAYSVTVLDELAGMGVELTIDDFGVAYSSLNHLRRFPVKTVKVDRSFIRDVTANDDDAAVVRAIVAMAHSLGLAVVAEGVETPAQFERVRQFRFDMVQGFLFGRPVPSEEVGPLLRRRDAFPALRRPRAARAR